MYLTELDDLIGDDYQIHVALSAMFHEQKILFQRRGQRVLVMSREPLGGSSRDISPILAKVKPGDEFLFVARLNPVITKFIDGKNRRVAIDPPRINVWLDSVFSKNGITAECTYRVEGIRRSRKDERTISLFSVLVNGVLVASEVDLFRKAVKQGVGHGKGLGFGLLNIFDFA